MNRKIIPFIVVFAISLSIYFIYQKYFSLRAKADKTIEYIATGELKFFGIQPVLIDNKNITTDLYLIYLSRKLNKKYDFSFQQQYQLYFFQLPKNIISYKFLKTNDLNFDFWDIEDIGKNNYESAWNNVYKNYDQYVNQMINLKIMSGDSFIFNKELSQLEIYKGVIREKRFFYKITAPDGIYLTKLCFLKLPKDGWKLGAVFTEKL